MNDHQPRTPLEESPRFRPPPTRRDVLGLAAMWSAVVAFAAALFGAIRLPMRTIVKVENSHTALPSQMAPPAVTQQDLPVGGSTDAAMVYPYTSPGSTAVVKDREEER